MKKIGVMLMLALMMCGATSCILGEAKPPYMVDRSEGWEFSFPVTAATSMETLSSKDGFDVWRELLVAQPVEPFGRVEETQVEKFAEKALRTVFGEAYLDAGGKHSIIKEELEDDVWLYRNGSVIVVLHKVTGEVWACIDTRLQPQFTIARGFQIEYDCNLEDLNREELLDFYSIGSSLPRERFALDATGAELPLDAQGAYDLAAKMINEGVYISGSHPLTITGGALYVYYCEKSDAFFIVSNTCVQAIAREDGQQLLLMELGSNTRRDRNRDKSKKQIGFRQQ